MKIYLIQQGVWDNAIESMPLASGYLKAVLESDSALRGKVCAEIINFRGGLSSYDMANKLLEKDAPDVLAFSVLGWNYDKFGRLAETYKQVKPDGIVIFGGNHVAGQGLRTFRDMPSVDLVVNGEGEFVFRDIIRSLALDSGRETWSQIEGISYRDAGGSVHTTQDRDRIEDLDAIPSPVLTGSIPLTDESGSFRYDVALMETNRGCPYKCSFCYWGGAVGQRVRAFSRTRLRGEVERLAEAGADTIVLCDANFGMLPSDLEFVEDVIEIRNRLGRPNSIEASWAKNKSSTFFKIVELMKAHDMSSSFTIALQTLNDGALETMNRRNMKLNDWEDLVYWLHQKGLDAYAELIWGAPGETISSFFQGYDRLSEYIPQIAVYPMLVLPNTHYFNNLSTYGMTTVRGDSDDFQYVLSHADMPLEDNQRVHRFIVGSRVLAENLVIRHSWSIARHVTGLKQSDVINSFVEWVLRQNAGSDIEVVRGVLLESFAQSDAIGPILAKIFGTAEMKDLLRSWWVEEICANFHGKDERLLVEAFQYDLATLPFYVHSDEIPKNADERWASVQPERGGDYLRMRNGWKGLDIPFIAAHLRAQGCLPDLLPVVEGDLVFRAQVDRFLPSTNHEEIRRFFAFLDTGDGCDHSSVSAPLKAPRTRLELAQ